MPVAAATSSGILWWTAWLAWWATLCHGARFFIWSQAALVRVRLATDSLSCWGGDQMSGVALSGLVFLRTSSSLYSAQASSNVGRITSPRWVFENSGSPAVLVAVVLYITSDRRFWLVSSRTPPARLRESPTAICCSFSTDLCGRNCLFGKCMG